MKRQRPRRLKVAAIDSPKRERQRPCSEIVIKTIDEPSDFTPEKQLDWLFQCLGFENDDVIAREILKELIKNSDRGIRSAEISAKCNVTQGAVVYHLNAFMRSGLVVKQGRYYHLKKPTLYATLSDLEEEVLRHFEKMRRLARILDEIF